MGTKLSDIPATQCLMALADSEGRLLEPGKTYDVDAPANMPVRQCWLLTVYDHAIMSFICTDLERTTLFFYDLGSMRKNPNGGITLYVGFERPKSLESNWIPTAGKPPLRCKRFYGPAASLNNRTFELPDFELAS